MWQRKEIMTLEEKLKHFQEKIIRNPLTSVTILSVVLLSLLIIIPYSQVNYHGIDNATQEATLENQYRATLAQILGGVAVGIGIYFAWGNLKVAQVTLESNQKKAQKSLEVSQEGQITELFTRAIDQLGATNKNGDPAVEIRLGGIYALKRIANESKKDYWPIIEILTAYIRENSYIKDQKVQKQDKLQSDIQAILSIIKKRNEPDDFIEPSGLDLQDTYLCKANLSEALFERADLTGVNLTEAHLEGANLKEANLEGANLKGANFEGAHLEGANFERANLEGAYLKKADLREANLKGANFEYAHLEGANFEGAYFTEINFDDDSIIKEAHFKGAHLEGTHLKKADLREANLKEAHFEDAHLEGAHLEGANLKEAHLCNANLKGASLNRVPHLCLEGANLERVYLWGADLTGANLEGVNIKGADFEGAILEGADFTEVDFEEDNIANSSFPELYNKHNLTIDQLSKVKSLYGAKNLSHEAELRKEHPEIFEETEDHKFYRENFMQCKL